MKTGRTRVTRSSQVTIPIDALREAGIGPDEVVSIYPDGEGRIVVERMQSLIERYARKLSGTWPGGVEGFLAERKRAWE
jgi:bifunctional DNA-binding transcriptional regulator/antitoxin component of YhaV-PrlF toxin-antitoxin module